MKENAMNRMTAIATYIALTAWTGAIAHAQPVSTPDARDNQTRHAAESVIRCAHHDTGTRAVQPCGVRKADEAMRLGSEVTSQEFECILSGKCGMTDLGRVTD